MSWHLIGIGGIGMSALAHILLQRREGVSGSDQRANLHIEALSALGAEVWIGAQGDRITQGATVVYSSAVGPNHPERVVMADAQHRVALLSTLMRGYHPLIVTGTHGKTTVSSLLAWILLCTGRDPAYALGGEVRGLSTHGRDGAGPFFVAEGDESDGSFLQLAPYGALVTNVDTDHLDHYGSLSKLQEAMAQFLQMPDHLVWCGDDPWLFLQNPAGTSYGLGKGCDVRAVSIEQEGFSLRFGVVCRGEAAVSFQVPLVGMHNVRNVLGAATLAHCVGLSWEEIATAVASFPGISRRCEVKGEVGGVLSIDDYAHHPTEVLATLEGIRCAVGERPIVALIEPHRPSRWKEQTENFKKALQLADRVVVTEVCAAGEEPVEGIDGPALATALNAEWLDPKRHRPHLQRGDCLVTMGAGPVTRKSMVRVGIIYGGASPEHEISVASAQWFMEHLDPARYVVLPLPLSRTGEWAFQDRPNEEWLSALLGCDVVIPALHGTKGEDGLIPALLEQLGIPFVGSDFRASAVCMDKVWSKQIASACGVSVLPFLALYPGTAPCEDALPPYPLYVKPAHLGSSLGVVRIENAEGLADAVETAFALDNRILLEKEVVGREFEFCFLGERVAHPAEILKSGDVHTFASKYGVTACPIDPTPDLPEQVIEEGKRMARTVFTACGCRGLGRVDAFLDRDHRWWFNESNPFPGCTPTSAFPLVWSAAGFTPSDVIDQLIDTAWNR